MESTLQPQTYCGLAPLAHSLRDNSAGCNHAVIHQINAVRQNNRSSRIAISSRRLPAQVIRLKSVAFNRSHKAKASFGAAQAAHYRCKHAAMNALLKMGFAFVNEANWRRDDPCFGLRFVGGGALHIPLSGLDREGLRVVRSQLNELQATKDQHAA
jgi:hypothetical protein